MKKEDVFSNELTVKATWQGGQYDCIPSGVDRSRRQFSETTLLSTTSAVRFWAADFTDGIPAIGDRLEIGGEVFRILEVHRFAPFLKYALGGEYGR